MATLKRRVVFLSDYEWDWLTGAAILKNCSRSEVIRHGLRGIAPIGVFTAAFVPGDAPDADARPTHEGVRPFAAFRPAPKPQRRKS